MGPQIVCISVPDPQFSRGDTNCKGGGVQTHYVAHFSQNNLNENEKKCGPTGGMHPWQSMYLVPLLM